RADSGSVELDGATVDDRGTFVRPEARRIGYVPQEGNLFPHVNVERNIAFGLPRSERKRNPRVAQLMEMVGLEGLGRRYPHELSGGQQQRVALARALAIEPRLVLLDEPFSSLDATLRAAVRADVRRVLKEREVTALLVTHDQDEALSLADQVAVIHDGRIGQHDSPLGLYRRPNGPALARSLGDSNILRGKVTTDGRSVATLLGELDLEESARDEVSGGTDVWVLVRPEQVECGPAGNGSGLRAVVTDYEYYGHDAVVTVEPTSSDAGAPEPLVVRVTGAGVSFALGTALTLRVLTPVVAWPASEGRD
ncbi:MAG TPA: ABC transporter ATP-binding protein, partial [Acidimicrobiales bacterium]|nr:ABC transporter ATP-binding protein [Acidimicrobiales bacterium]